jgi:hypothetical protein
LGYRKIKVVAGKSISGDALSFLVAYLLPLIPKLSGKTDVEFISVVFVLAFFVVFHSNSYYFNPMLTILGYRFYEVTTDANITFVSITKRKLKNIKQVDTVVQLTDHMILEKS